MNHEKNNQKLESSVLLLNASFIAFEALNSANSSASSSVESISVLNGSLYHKTCNVLWLKYGRNSAETISRFQFCDASFNVIWQSNLIHFQAPFQQRKRGSGQYLDLCLPDSHSSS